MLSKNRLLQRAERELRIQDPRWANRRTAFGWQGGKGVILTSGPGQELTPARLICHGLLVEHLRGEYFASEDQGVGKGELRWIARSTHFTVGLGCAVDTGDPTAIGVLAAIYQAALTTRLVRGPELSALEVLSPECPPILEGLSVLVIGAGKVGLPLLGFLARRGARCFVFDPALAPDRIPEFVRQNLERGAAIDRYHTELLVRLAKEGRILTDERRALQLEEVQIISPNGGRTDWLKHAVDGKTSTAGFLAAAKAKGGTALRLIVGAGNAQLVDDPRIRGDAEEVLEVLRKEEIDWIPDPAVSPGGVIAVSHEQQDAWVLENVRADAFDVVRHNVRKLYEGASLLGAVDSVTLYEAFQVRLQARDPEE
ncbi:MAG: hypothetical protein EXS08_06750 [Planctomycetes bacterium]|nr:hypothetical protein [Planctomycetota bacterium]